MPHTYSVSKAQAQLPRLIRETKKGQVFTITNRDEPSAYLVPADVWDSLLESLELSADPKARSALRRYRAGHTTLKPLSVVDED